MTDVVSPMSPAMARGKGKMADPNMNDVISPMTPDSVHAKYATDLRGGFVRSEPSYSSLRPSSAGPPNYRDIYVEEYGKEAVPMSDEKQVVHHDGLEQDRHPEEKHVVVPYEEKEAFIPDDESERRRKRICGMTVKVLTTAIIILVLCAAAIAVAIPLVLKKNHKDTKPAAADSSEQAPHPKILTGIDYDEPFDNPGSQLDPLTDIFYQRKDNVLRQATMLTNGSYLAAGANDNVADDAQSGTPIAVTSFTVSESERRPGPDKNSSAGEAQKTHGRSSCTEDCTLQRHLFYIDTNGILREKTYDNVTRIWKEGSIGKLEIKPVANPGLKVCTGNDFIGNGSSSFRDGLSVFYGSGDTTVTQIGWNYGDKTWIKEQTFTEVNGHGGIACYIRPESTSAIMQNGTDIQFWWRDSNSTHQGNATHPVGVWAKAPISISGIFVNASFDLRSFRNAGQPRGKSGWNKYIVTQMADLTIRAYNITGSSEQMQVANITYGTKSFASVPISQGRKGLPGTHIAFTADPGPLGRNSTERTWITWFQTKEGVILQSQANANDLEKWKTDHVSVAS